MVTIDDPTLPSSQHDVNNINDYGFSGRTGRWTRALRPFRMNPRELEIC
jgi:hypothetical protein